MYPSIPGTTIYASNIKTFRFSIVMCHRLLKSNTKWHDFNHNNMIWLIHASHDHYSVPCANGELYTIHCWNHHRNNPMESITTLIVKFCLYVRVADEGCFYTSSWDLLCTRRRRRFHTSVQRHHSNIRHNNWSMNIDGVDHKQL